MKHYNTVKDSVNPVLAEPAQVTVREVRRDNLMRLIGASRVSDFARTAHVSEKYVRLVQHEHAGMGSCFARKLERAMGQPRGWMDADHSAPRLDVDAAALVSRWLRLSDGRRAFVAGQLLLAEQFNFGNDKIDRKDYQTVMRRLRANA